MNGRDRPVWWIGRVSGVDFYEMKDGLITSATVYYEL